MNLTRRNRRQARFTENVGGAPRRPQLPSWHLGDKLTGTH